MNLKLELLNYFDLTRCLCELKTESGESGITAPKEYISDGNWDNVDFDAFDGVSYWRLRDEITTTPLENAYKAGKRVEITVPLKLVFSVRREKLTADDAYSYDRIRQTIVKQFNIDDGDLKTSLGAEKVLITSPTANGDAKEVWDGETANTGTFEPKYEVVFGSVDIDVVIISKGECLPAECDDVDSDILHAFDFCNAAVRDRLTETQIDCLIDAYCGACDPATLTVNGNTFTTVDSGDTLDIAVHDTSNTDVGTVVSTSEIEIADSTNEVNGVDIAEPTVAEGTHNQVIQNSSSTPVGTAANPSVIGDSQAQVNGVNTETIAATVTHNQQIQDSAGGSVGTAANPSVISDNTINFNGSDVDTVKAQETYTFTVELDSVESGTYDAGTNTVSVSSVPPSLAVAISDTTPDVGDEVDIVATPTGITPTSYTFYTPLPNGGYVRTNQVSGTLSWRVSVKGVGNVYVTATDGSNEVAGEDDFTSSWLGFDDAAVLNGSTQYFQTDANDFQSVFSENSWYINVWFNADSLANVPVLFASTDSQEFIEIGSSNVYVRWGNSLRTYTGVAISTGTWYMLTVVKHHDGDNMCVYIDGVMLPNWTGTVADHNATAKAIIVGKFTSGSFHFDGKLDELSIKAGCTPTQAQIVAAYNSGSGDAVTDFGTYPDMWLPFNGDGLDSSGNGYDTTAYNGVTYAAH